MSSLDEVATKQAQIEVCLKSIEREFHRRLAAIEADIKRQRRRAMQRAITRALCDFSLN